MSTRSVPIRRKLTRMLVLSSGIVLMVTAFAFSTYEVLAFRQSSVEELRILTEAIAGNSTAALAFQNADDATSILSALKADPHLTRAALYDEKGTVFAVYPQGSSTDAFPKQLGAPGFSFTGDAIIGFQPVVADQKTLGTLYVRSDLSAMYARLGRYAVIVLLVVAASLPLIYFLSRKLQGEILRPVVALGDTARAVSERHDLTVRAKPTGAYELDLFTDTFNQMLSEVQASERKLQDQLSRLNLLQQITRAIGERLDLASIFQVVLPSLEENLPIDFGCFLTHDAAAGTLTVSGLGIRGRPFAEKLGLTAGSNVPIDENGLSRCVRGQLVYEPDVREVPFAFPQGLANVGLRALVIAPLLVENEVFGVLAAARTAEHAFSSGECEFLRQLSEHVALASHQARLYGELQHAYEDLRQSQHAVLQQERLRALGQMASGIAHDINNAISPVSLYTESLLEREPNLSPRARDYLSTIQQAIEDVARTVSRMREFYREREAQLTLERVALNRAIRQVAELTRPRWSDLPQQRGLMIDLKMQLEESLPDVMGAENEIRDALTNLVFNAVDAMPSGGTLWMRSLRQRREGADDRVSIEVSDTGVGMDEETRRRCLEPFYTTKGERGTGLGLAMVYGMVQRHSAEIEIESKAGIGTTIRLSFPAHTASIVTAEQSADATGVIVRLRILLVDDDPVLIKSLRDTLEEDGHVVTATHGGQAGIDAFSKALGRSEPFDVVITDLGMPHVDGRKVAAAIKGLSSSTPVILLTGWGQRLLAEQEKPENVDQVLSKPPRLAELRPALARLAALNGRPAPTA